jgi:hypothetical protein
MKNVNKDYLVEVNVKTAEIKAPKDMKFHITDIYTCNIFFKLVFDEPKRTTEKVSISDYFDKDYMPKEDVVNYTLTLRVLRPNGEPIDSIEVDLLNKGKEDKYGKDLLYVDLEPEYLNMLGIYECELFIKATVDGREEINTTDSFEFEVVKSIFTDLSEAIESDPDYPLLADIYATKKYVQSAIKDTAKYMDLYGYATRDYVNQVAMKGEVDLSDYVTEEELAQALIDLSVGGSIDLSVYVTEKELEQALAGFSGGGGYNPELESELRELIDGKADSKHVHEEYATNDSVDEKIAEVKTNKVKTISAVDNVLTLTDDKYQRAEVNNDIKIMLPTGHSNGEPFASDEYIEIHLFLIPSEDIEIEFPLIKRQAMPPFRKDTVCELIFTYIGEEWLAGAIAYV